MSGRWLLAQAGQGPSPIAPELPEGVWPALGVLLLSLLMVAVVMRVRSLRRDARARRRSREARPAGGAPGDEVGGEDNRDPARPIAGRSAPTILPEPSSARDLPANPVSSRAPHGSPEVKAESRTATPPEPPEPPPVVRARPVARPGPAMADENGSSPRLAVPAARGHGRIEARLFDAEGRPTRDGRQAVRGEMVGYDAAGRELGRAALELPGPERARRSPSTLTTRRRRVPPPTANGRNGPPTTRRRRRPVAAGGPLSGEKAASEHAAS